MITWLLLSTILGGATRAESSAADDLIKTLNGGSIEKVDTQSASNNAVQNSEISLNNAIARKLYLDWTTQKGLSYEMNSWVKQFFQGQYESFAHQKDAISKQIPSSMQQSAQAAYLYSLFKLNVPQTFFDSWVTSLSNPAFFDSNAAQALEENIAPQFDRWLVQNHIQLQPSQKTFISKMDLGSLRSEIYLNLIAYTKIRSGLGAKDVLARLSVNNELRPLLAKTVALALARSGDLGGAAKTLKNFYEPSLVSRNDVNALAGHYLQIARFLYQAGSIDGAIQYYEKVPTGVAEYVTAREELGWCWLRKGDMSKLRGNVATLTSDVLKDQFRPESYLVRAISNLKLCHYQEVQDDLKEFQVSHAPWAKKIESAIQASDSVQPRYPDQFTKDAMAAVGLKEQEKAKLEVFFNNSLQAGLPSVGPQVHWKNAANQMQVHIEEAKKRLADESRRQWKNDKAILSEAIRKMQFVKVELLSQVSSLSANDVKATNNDALKIDAKKEISRAGEVVFPFDGTVWPDEVFKLRAVTEGRCGKM